MSSSASVARPSVSRPWKRRARTIPAMLGATLVGVVASPVVMVVAAVVDIARRRFRLPTVRVALFLLQYGINDSVEIILAPVYWVRAGFGRRLHEPASVARHDRLQRWSIEVLARRAERLLGVRLEIDPVSLTALTPGPVIVLCRHVNIVDASLPTLLYQRHGYRTRGVIMAELLADPGFDLIYGRTGSVFVPRDRGPEALALVRTLAAHVDSATAVVIFPEGRLFRPDRLARARERLASEHPDRAQRLASLRHVLPPRPGGILALLDTVPADVVVIGHVGLDRFGSFAELARAVPLRDPIRVTAWRIAADRIPDDDAGRVAWLDAQWVRLDDQITDGTAS